MRITKPDERPISVTYEDVRKLIYRTVHHFARAKGGDVEELIGEANAHYIRAYNTWQPEKGPFEAWVVYIVRIQLLETARTMARRKAKLGEREDLDGIAQKESSKFDVAEFASGLGEDAKAVISFVTQARLSGDEWTERKLRNALEFAGWAGNQITEAFREIREALNPPKECI